MNAPANLPALIEALPADATRTPQTEFTRALQARFLEALAARGSVRSAAKSAGVSNQSAYRMRRKCAAFRLAWDAALLTARAHAEDVLATRAIDGVEEEVWYHGEIVATRRRYDARLLLAHLARLDRLTANERVHAFTEDFEGALERFVEGSDTPEKAPKAKAAKKDPGQCSTRSKSRPPKPAKEWCPYDKAMVPPLTKLINAMDAARPRGAKQPYEFHGYEMGEVEAEQLCAFEEGVDRWWLVVPAGPDDDPDEWCYADED